MKKMRWAADGEGRQWELDLSTPVTLEGEAKPVPGDPLPLGVTRGHKLSRYKQIDFFQRFMALPYVPSSSSSSHGFSLLRSLSFPLTSDWFLCILGRFNLQKLVSTIRADTSTLPRDEFPLLRKLREHIRDESLYALGFCSEMSLTPRDTLLLSVEGNGEHREKHKKRAVFHHEFPSHDLTLEATNPGLFIDNSGNYWDVPLSVAMDLASVTSPSGSSYHLCMRHNSGEPIQHGNSGLKAPASLLPGTSVKYAYSLKRTLDLWRSERHKLKLVQPYDFLICNPHLSVSGVIGGAVTGKLGDNVGDEVEKLCVRGGDSRSSLTADIFSSISVSAQLGNFQKLCFDLTRCGLRLDFPSGWRCLAAARRMADVEAAMPDVTVSFQQQIVGPFSLRVDAGVMIDLTGGNTRVHFKDPVFAMEHSLHVLGSAKAVAWFSPTLREFMAELRFFQT